MIPMFALDKAAVARESLACHPCAEVEASAGWLVPALG
jgi:hypothetical protein